jgi:Rrf2 family protein
MLLTRAGEYALLTLITISKSDKPMSVNILSRKLDISESFLAKILQHLAKNNIVKSHRGTLGGFALNKEPKDITLLEILKSVEKNSTKVFKCTITEKCSRGRELCLLLPFLCKLQTKIDTFLIGFTLEDLSKE